ncbi:MAG: hypothetical protein JNL82_05525 [Myxococcales bacterium]|nr:hypothetical protein [Myxococcales bacterium]
MTPSISKSASSALALALIAPGCGYGDCSDDVTILPFKPSGPGTVAVHVHGSTPARTAYVAASWFGTAINRGTEPCRIAVYEHALEPDPATIPVLTRNQPAPLMAGEGRRVFESLLPGVRDGHTLVRELEEGNALGDDFNFGDYLEPDDDPDLNHIDVWLTVATCEAPDIEVNLEIRRELCPARARGEIAADVWWSAETP